MWIAELLLGMALGYYATSKGFRAWVNSLVVREKPRETRKGVRVIPRKEVEPELELEMPKNVVVVSGEEVAKWLRDNPELAKLNEVAK